MATAPATMNKTISGLAFTISAPYVAGQTINELEAKVLNQTRSENIGNNLRKAINDAVTAGKSEKEIAAIVQEADASYVFSARAVGEGRTRDPYESEARKLAREILKAHLAKDGRKLTVAPNGMTKEEWEAKIEENLETISANDKVVAAAKKNVDARKKNSDALMASLDGVNV